MLLTYRIKEDLCVKAEQYTHNLNKSVKEIVLKKYVFKITKMGFCVKVKSIQIVDNIILRKDAEMLLSVFIELVILSLVPN